MQIAQALEYLHGVKVYHNDLKLENVMITLDHKVKIIDFGIAIYNPKDLRLKGKCGSYSGPETVPGKSYRCGPVDVYALGAILFYCVTGTYPFYNK